MVSVSGKSLLPCLYTVSTGGWSNHLTPHNLRLPLNWCKFSRPSRLQSGQESTDTWALVIPSLSLRVQVYCQTSPGTICPEHSSSTPYFCQFSFGYSSPNTTWLIHNQKASRWTRTDWFCRSSTSASPYSQNPQKATNPYPAASTPTPSPTSALVSGSHGRQIVFYYGVSTSRADLSPSYQLYFSKS